MTLLKFDEILILHFEMCSVERKRTDKFQKNVWFLHVKILSKENVNHSRNWPGYCNMLAPYVSGTRIVFFIERGHTWTMRTWMGFLLLNTRYVSLKWCT